MRSHCEMSDHLEIPHHLEPESVWDYPRPPALEKVDRPVKVVFNEVIVAESNRAYRILETSHPPVYYIHPQDVRMDLLEIGPGQSFCEYKGQAKYWSLLVDGKLSKNAAWSYPSPSKQFGAISEHLAFYASRVDECWVGHERVTPQAGDFYGGWITESIVGPFKGGPGTWGW